MCVKAQPLPPPQPSGVPATPATKHCRSDQCFAICNLINNNSSSVSPPCGRRAAKRNLQPRAPPEGRLILGRPAGLGLDLHSLRLCQTSRQKDANVCKKARTGKQITPHFHCANDFQHHFYFGAIFLRNKSVLLEAKRLFF